MKISPREFERLYAIGRRPRKLSFAKAQEMRHKRFVLKKKQRELSLEFGVVQGIVSRVCSGQIWNQP